MSTNSFDTTRFLRRTLWVIFIFSVAGILFSGTLAYRELTGAAVSCQVAGAAGTILGLPVCVYGLGMFALLAALAAFGLYRTRGLAVVPA